MRSSGPWTWIASCLALTFRQGACLGKVHDVACRFDLRGAGPEVVRGAGVPELLVVQTHMLIKMHSGGDEIQIRRNRVDEYAVINQSMIMLFVNNVPVIDP